MDNGVGNTHKYEFELPMPGQDIVQNATDLDRKNSDTLWKNSLSKEMGNLNIEFLS
jgi:hypothetical protein